MWWVFVSVQLIQNFDCLCWIMFNTSFPFPPLKKETSEEYRFRITKQTYKSWLIYEQGTFAVWWEVFIQQNWLPIDGYQAGIWLYYGSCLTFNQIIVKQCSLLSSLWVVCLYWYFFLLLPYQAPLTAVYVLFTSLELQKDLLSRLLIK